MYLQHPKRAYRKQNILIWLREKEALVKQLEPSRQRKLTIDVLAEACSPNYVQLVNQVARLNKDEIAQVLGFFLESDAEGCAAIGELHEVAIMRTEVAEEQQA